MNTERLRSINLGTTKLYLISNGPVENTSTPIAFLISFRVFNPILFQVLKGVLTWRLKRHGLYVLFDRAYPKILDGPREMRGNWMLLGSDSLKRLEELGLGRVEGILLRMMRPNVFPLMVGGFERMNPGRTDFTSKELYSRRLKYLVHMYREKDGDKSPSAELLADHDVYVHFHGKLTTLVGQKIVSNLKTLPCPYDRILILVSFDKSDLVEILRENFYVKFLESNAENFIGLFE